MRAIICDTCGKQVPDTINADIMILTISYSKIHEDAKIIERDICPVCMAKLVGFFEAPEPAAEAIEETIVTQEPQPVAEPIVEAPADTDPEPEPVIEIIAKPTFEPVIAADTINCKHCHIPFVPRTKKALTCSKHCSQQAWIDDQKLKKAAETKKTQDELLARLKRENPVPRDKEPVFAREL